MMESLKVINSGDCLEIECCEADLSVVIPVYNEKDSLPALHSILLDVLTDMGINFEVLYIDDGSHDGSLDVLAAFANEDARVRVIVFRRNYGQTPALAAGFKHSRGKTIVCLDADMQNDPRDIPILVEKIQRGADVVSGWRKKRKESLKRRLPSLVANYLINWLISSTGVRLHDYGCTLKAYRAEVVKNIRLYGDMHRFIPAFAAWLGVVIEEVEVTHHPRHAGHSKYGLKRIFPVLLDFFLVRFFADYLTKPSRFFGKIAGFFFLFGILLAGGVVTGSTLWGWDININTILIILLSTLLLSVQSLSLGLLGEMHMRSYFEAQGKVPYVIRNILQSPTVTTSKLTKNSTPKK